jgi:hypothetical protein
MRDWRAYVEHRLGPLKLERAEADEVVQELAGHLEEHYDGLRMQGVSEEDAFSRTCAEAGNWAQLRRGVISAKESGMSDRVRQIWIPGLVTLLVGWGGLALMIWRGAEPTIWRPGNSPSWMYMVMYWPWLAVLPLIGAFGAYLSRRAQARRWRVCLAGAFPAFAIGCVLLLIIPWALIIDTHVAHDFAWLGGVGLMMVGWVGLPGAALWLGVALQGWLATKPGTMG